MMGEYRDNPLLIRDLFSLTAIRVIADSQETGTL